MMRLTKRACYSVKTFADLDRAGEPEWKRVSERLYGALSAHWRAGEHEKIPVHFREDEEALVRHHFLGEKP